MKFIITSDMESYAVYPGMIITYKVSPLWGIRMNWMTEITHVGEGKYFVDDQRSGPFSIWNHQHHFRPIPGGTEMIDILHYRAPLGFLGRIAERLFVNRRVRGIFEYRREMLDQKFGKWEEG